MRIITANVNGIRSAARKGFFEWLDKQKADIVCLQEVRAQTEQLVDPIFYPKGYYHYYVEAEKKGYSGVAIYSLHKPKQVETDLGLKFADNEGRYVHVEFPKLIVASVYMPSGTSSDDRQAKKYKFMDYFESHLEDLSLRGKPVIICGDWNIAHTERDIKNWKANQKNSGFLPQERAWLDTLFGELGYVDAFRVKNQGEDEYTWWSQRGRARENNVGWRIDYQVVSQELGSKIQCVDIYRDEKFSDHAPLSVDYRIKI